MKLFTIIHKMNTSSLQKSSITTIVCSFSICCFHQQRGNLSSRFSRKLNNLIWYVCASSLNTGILLCTCKCYCAKNSICMWHRRNNIQLEWNEKVVFFYIIAVTQLAYFKNNLEILKRCIFKKILKKCLIVSGIMSNILNG